MVSEDRVDDIDTPATAQLQQSYRRKLRMMNDEETLADRNIFSGILDQYTPLGKDESNNILF